MPPTMTLSRLPPPDKHEGTVTTHGTPARTPSFPAPHQYPSVLRAFCAFPPRLLPSVPSVALRCHSAAGRWGGDGRAPALSSVARSGVRTPTPHPRTAGAINFSAIWHERFAAGVSVRRRRSCGVWHPLHSGQRAGPRRQWRRHSFYFGVCGRPGYCGPIRITTVAVFFRPRSACY